MVDNSSSSHIKTLKKHFRRFGITFGDRNIHEITAAEVTEWLGRQKSDDKNDPWSPKTRKSVRGSLVSLAGYAHLRKQFWGRHLWGRGYLAVSAGSITEKLVADYIAEQEGEPVHDDSRFLID